MNEIKFKNYIFYLVTLIVSALIALLIANFALIKLTPTKLFPRSLAGSLSNTLLTFYPNTYNLKNLDNKIEKKKDKK